MDKEIEKLTATAQRYSAQLMAVRDEMAKVIVGQEAAVERMLLALLAQGHVLIEGVPGLAKTLMIRTLSDCLDSGFVRIQFTPDLLPADITGTKIYDHADGSFKTVLGPVFTNFILADEINRAPPKVQSALLESMQERQVSIQGETHALPVPFMVLATQNPIESEGTYKLPEAQVDRFMFKLLIGHPTKEEERRIIERFTGTGSHAAKKRLTSKQVVAMQRFTRTVYADRKVQEYVAEIVNATRHPDAYGLELDGLIEYGASPRASLWLILGAKAHALLDSRGYVVPEDVKAVAHDVLRHRLILSYEAEAEGRNADGLLDLILGAVRVP